MDPSVKEAFYKDVFSNHFNQLMYLGQWNVETDDPVKKNLFFVYKTFAAMYGITIATSGLLDLYFSLGDIEKTFFNVCTTILSAGITYKNIVLHFRSDRLNKLRRNLFQDGWDQKNNPEDVAIRAKFAKILLNHKKTFYAFAYTVLPIWLGSALLTFVWGPREMPFQLYMPLDLNNDFQYFCGFIFQTLSSMYIVAETIHADLALFSLTLQISAQYQILAKNVSQINKIYLDKFPAGYKKMKDINKILLNHQTKEKLKVCIKRQLVLSGYVKEVENIYNFLLFLQLIVGIVLSIGNGIELMMSSMSVSVKLSYQIGYTLIVLGDVYMCCNLADLLMTEVHSIEWSLYDTVWYEMDSEIRRYLVLSIMGAQNVRPLTAAKMFGLNLSTYLGLLKNVYSWLALCQQLFIKN